MADGKQDKDKIEWAKQAGNTKHERGMGHTAA